MASLVSPTHGARFAGDGWGSHLAVAYTSAAKNAYFGWTDARTEIPSGLARKFIERPPEIVEAGRGSDWLDAGWYIEMFGLTYPNQFPYASADWEISEYFLPTVTIGEKEGTPVRIPLPPAIHNGIRGMDSSRDSS